MVDGHEEGGDLGVGDELLFGSAVDECVDESVDLGVGEDAAVALVQDDIDGMDGLCHFICNSYGCKL